jgi:hypothetical protein
MVPLLASLSSQSYLWSFQYSSKGSDFELGFQTPTLFAFVLAALCAYTCQMAEKSLPVALPVISISNYTELIEDTYIL